MPFRNLREALWPVLFPLSVLWAVAARLRHFFYTLRPGYRSPLVVWSIGNIHSGGTGKTPIVAEIARHFSSYDPVILSRGYKSLLSKKGAWIDVSKPDGPKWYGDEAWCLANRLHARVYVGRDRVRGLRCVEKETRKGLVLLDDGFQHLKVERHLDLVLIPTDLPLEDSFCLPLGELREGLGALARASLLLLNRGQDQEHFLEWEDFLARHFPRIPRFVALRQVEGLWENGARAILEGAAGAFCGIARSHRFLKDVQKLLLPRFFLEFPDHHAYAAQDFDRLREEASKAGVNSVITTEKDFAKVNRALTRRGLRVMTLGIHYELPEEFWYFLTERLKQL